MPDVTQILSSQHREVESLFDTFEASTDRGQRGDTARQIVENLSRHAAVEEMSVYPVIAESVGEADAASLLDEHQDLKEVLAEIDGLDPGHPDLAARMTTARQLVDRHVAEEEGQVFPRLRAQVPETRLEELGAEIERQWSSAPTHPHPHAPNTPPANKVTGPAAGMVDKVRDALRGD